jgi:hypothetical protein
MARALTIAVVLVAAGCGSSASSAPSAPADDAGTREHLDAGGPVAESGSGSGPGSDSGAASDAGSRSISDSGSGSASEGGADSGAAASRFVTGVVQFNPTDCTGFGKSSLPGVVEGPPVGGGSDVGSIDVVSLGSGGSIVVTFAPNAIVDGPGPDFIVFENPFWIGGNSNDIYAEPGEISVSDDGQTWTPFPCTPTVDPGATDGTGTAPPYGTCGGWGVVDSTPTNGISPFDPATAGGNAFDLADIGVTHARFVKIVDQTREACPDAGGPTTNGFDLDAIAIVNAALP